MSLNLPLQNLLQNTQHMCSFCVLGRPCQISSAVLIRPIRAFCPWNLAWIWHLSLIWTNHNKSLSFSCFISWETAYFGIFVKKLALFLEITSARRGTSLRTALCVWLRLQVHVKSRQICMHSWSQKSTYDSFLVFHCILRNCKIAWFAKSRHVCDDALYSL